MEAASVFMRRWLPIGSTFHRRTAIPRTRRPVHDLDLISIRVPRTEQGIRPADPHRPGLGAKMGRAMDYQPTPCRLLHSIMSDGMEQATPLV